MAHKDMGFKEGRDVKKGVTLPQRIDEPPKGVPMRKSSVPKGQPRKGSAKARYW